MINDGERTRCQEGFRGRKWRGNGVLPEDSMEACHLRHRFHALCICGLQHIDVLQNIRQLRREFFNFLLAQCKPRKLCNVANLIFCESRHAQRIQSRSEETNYLLCPFLPAATRKDQRNAAPANASPPAMPFLTKSSKASDFVRQTLRAAGLPRTPPVAGNPPRKFTL